MTDLIISQREDLLSSRGGANLDTRDTMIDPTIVEVKKKKWLSFRINVEPSLFLLSICVGILVTIAPLFLFWTRCVEIADYLPPIPNSLDNSTIRCAQIFSANETFLRNAVEEDIAQMKFYMQLANFATFITAPVLGLWSDKYQGRKKVLLFTLTGLFIYTSLQLFAITFYKFYNVYNSLILAEFVMGSFGGVPAVFTSMIAIIVDDSRSSGDTKTGIPIRIFLSTSIQTIAFLLGNLITSFFMVPASVSIAGHERSYFILVAISLGATSLSLIYSSMFVKDTSNPEISEKSFSNSIGSIFNGLADVLTSPRRGHLRLVINLSIFLIAIDCMNLDSSLMVLLLKSSPFNWPDTEFTYLAIVKTSVGSVGMVLIPLLISFLPIYGHDSVLLIIGFTSNCLISFIIGYATTDFHIYLTGFLSIFSSVLTPAFRSFLPKLVDKDQTARLFTIISLIFVITPIPTTFLLNNIYKKTFHFWPGLVFVVIGFVNCGAIAIQIITHLLLRPQWKENTNEIAYSSLASPIECLEEDGIVPNTHNVTSSDETLNTANINLESSSAGKNENH